MNRSGKWIAGAGIAVVLLGGASGAAFASGQVPAVPGLTADDSEDSREQDRPITGDALDKAKAAALAHTGGGRVTGTEVGDEEGYYEVEVTKDGREIDVHLDKNFTVLGDESDGTDDPEK